MSDGGGGGGRTKTLVLLYLARSRRAIRVLHISRRKVKRESERAGAN